MIQLLKMAYRDLGRNRRRSFFSALALGIGLSLLLLMAAVVKGEMQGALESGLRLESGHVQVRASSYDANKTSLAWKDLIDNPDALATQIAILQPVKVATPRLFASGIVANGDESLGVRIVGIDPASEANVPYKNGIVGGSFLQADDREGILVGKPLADKLALNVGDQVSLLVNTSNGDVDSQSFIVRGVYDTHTPGIDKSTVLMPLAKAQAITQTENHASTIFILLNDREQADSVAAAIQAPQYQVKTWVQMNELIVQFEQFADAYMGVLYLIILGITATVIVNTLIMAVFERTREIGILSAIGMKSGRIMAMFLTESSLLAVGGILIGLALGGVFVALATYNGIYLGDIGVTGMAFGDTIYAHLTVSDAVSLTVIAFIVTLLASLYPAILAARMEPVEALHGGK
jgi:ABC-type lipoprotein release transport system permease subunit